MHSEVHKQLPALLAAAAANHYQKRFYRAVHEAFYNPLPDKFRWVETKESTRLEVPPGELRTTGVRVGRCESQQRRWPPLRSE